MAGVVRRDGLREAVTALRDEWLAINAAEDFSHFAGELSRVLDAVPDVPPTEDCGNDCMTSEGHREGCPVHCGCYDVPPDPPAADRDELARVVHQARTTVPMCTEDDSESCWPIADALLSSGVLVDAADVRARALEDAAERARERDDFAADGVDIFLLKLADDIRKKHRLHPYGDRAVSERDRRRIIACPGHPDCKETFPHHHRIDPSGIHWVHPGSRPPADTDTGRGQ